MNYTYDIYLNLNKTLYDFFDWNKNDKIIHIKKIPIFKVSVDNLKKLVNSNIKINESFLNNIYNKTELWSVSEKIEFCSLFCDYNNIIAIEFDKNGNSIKKSHLVIEEELEILETITSIKEKNIDFEIISKTNNIFKTRKQIKDESFIDKELKNMTKEKLDYIYFECFGKREKNRKIIIKNIKNIKHNSISYKNLYDILKLTSKTSK